MATIAFFFFSFPLKFSEIHKLTPGAIFMVDSKVLLIKFQRSILHLASKFLSVMQILLTNTKKHRKTAIISEVSVQSAN